MLPEFMLPEPMLPPPMLPELVPADPTSNGWPCLAALRLSPFRRSIWEFCEVSVWPERDDRMA